MEGFGVWGWGMGDGLGVAENVLVLRSMRVGLRSMGVGLCTSSISGVLVVHSINPRLIGDAPRTEQEGKGVIAIPAQRLPSMLGPYLVILSIRIHPSDAVWTMPHPHSGDRNALLRFSERRTWSRRRDMRADVGAGRFDTEGDPRGRDGSWYQPEGGSEDGGICTFARTIYLVWH